MISFDGKTLSIDGRRYELEHPVVDAIEHENLVVVLFDPAAYTSKFGQFANLQAFSRIGEPLWTAELATNKSGDRYYKVAKGDVLRAASIYSFVCDIDLNNGQIARREFLK